MFLEASDDTDASPIEKATMVYRSEIFGENTYQELTDHYVLGEGYNSKDEYCRYWHGYQVLLMPLLEFMDYSNIRILNLLVQIVLVVLIGLLLVKHHKFYYFPAYIVAYLMLMPVVIGKCLQFSACYYAFSLGVIVLLSGKVSKKYTFLVFLNIGIFTAYFDLFTYPVATFGVPAVFYITLDDEQSSSKKIEDIVKNGIAWCIGFGGMWCSKWLVTFLLTGYNAFSEGIDAFALRISHGGQAGETYSVLDCEIKNYSTFASTPITIIAVIVIVYLIINIYSKKTILKEKFIEISLPYFIVAIIPMVWYAFALNHSEIHYWFTNKACIVTLLATLFCLINAYQYKNNINIENGFDKISLNIE